MVLFERRIAHKSWERDTLLGGPEAIMRPAALGAQPLGSGMNTRIDIVFNCLFCVYLRSLAVYMALFFCLEHRSRLIDSYDAFLVQHSPPFLSSLSPHCLALDYRCRT